jgi:hypothetical protein
MRTAGLFFIFGALTGATSALQEINQMRAGTQFIGAAWRVQSGASTTWCIRSGEAPN